MEGFIFGLVLAVIGLAVLITGVVTKNIKERVNERKVFFSLLHSTRLGIKLSGFIDVKNYCQKLPLDIPDKLIGSVEQFKTDLHTDRNLHYFIFAVYNDAILGINKEVSVSEKVKCLYGISGINNPGLLKLMRESPVLAAVVYIRRCKVRSDIDDAKRLIISL